MRGMEVEVEVGMGMGGGGGQRGVCNGRRGGSPHSIKGGRAILR